MEPLLEIAKLVTPELNLQLIYGWLSPRMIQVFKVVAEIYHNNRKFIFDENDETVPLEFVSPGGRNFSKYWPLEVTKDG